MKEILLREKEIVFLVLLYFHDYQYLNKLQIDMSLQSQNNTLAIWDNCPQQLRIVACTRVIMI